MRWRVSFLKEEIKAELRVEVHHRPFNAQLVFSGIPIRQFTHDAPRHKLI